MWLRSKNKYSEVEIWLIIESLNNFRKRCFITEEEEKMCLELVTKLASEVDMPLYAVIDI